MHNSGSKSALDKYKKVGNETNVAYASPHRLIQMLFEGALEKIYIAKGAMERGEIAKKGQNISWAINIIEGLRTSLNKSAGGEIAENLDALYTYVAEQLVLANSENSQEKLDEAVNLLKTIKSAWDDIADQIPAGTEGHSESIVTATVR